MRVIFDNNVLISAALLKHSFPYLAFKKAVNDPTITLLRSNESLTELNNTISNTKFDKYFKDEIKREEFLVSFIFESVNIKIMHKINECRDPKDNKYLELALSGTADCIITGDKDLLVLNPFRGISIITPKEFLNN